MPFEGERQFLRQANKVSISFRSGVPVLVWGDCEGLIILLDKTRPKRVGAVVGEIRL
ncbi:TPA: hypothetical protein ACG3JU_003898 [Clostridioides difficile]